MEYFAVQGGVPLEGCVAVHGAKNSALPILAATLLAPGEHVLHNCPNLTDITAALAILSCLGCQVRREGSTVVVNTLHRRGCAVPDHLMGQMRASVLFLGSLLASSGEAMACWPGGCALGERPIDLHLRALRLLGAQVLDRGGRLSCRCPRLRGNRIVLPFPSVGATENAMLAACGAQGVTEICNAAQELEIVDLQNFLQACGAQISGGGTERIVVYGGAPLHPGEHSVMPDRIVTATYLCAVAAAGGEGELLSAQGGAVAPVLQALTAAGCQIWETERGLAVRRRGALRGIGSVVTAPYPGFPTDAQPLLAAVLAKARGDSAITETIFDRRFRYTQQLCRMGAHIRVEGDTAHFSGAPLHGAAVKATDLRGGAALAIAALGAQGCSRVYGLEHIDRGYERLEHALGCLGGRIRRTTYRQNN